MNILNKIILLFFLTSITSLSGQTYKQMMHDPSVNIYDVVEEAEAHFKDKDKFVKGSGWKGFQRWLFENEAKYYPSGDRSNIDPYFVSKNYNP